MTRATDIMRGNSLTARVLRSSSWVLIGFGSSQALRLASNLILTRILYPEAFGVLALVMVVLIGLEMMSDVGVRATIARSERGDDPSFLNTVWTIQVIRSALLWLVCILLAHPVSEFYAQSDLALYVQIASFSIILNGFAPTRVHTANRHLLIGRLTILDLGAQVLGLICMIALALIMQSPAALVIGMVFQAAIRLSLTWFLLPGHHDRFGWERDVVIEMIRFGKWILFSTACHFLTSQGDRLILGKFISMAMLGTYNIGFFLAGFPAMLGNALSDKLMLPVYREKPARGSPENIRNHKRLRTLLTTCTLALALLAAAIGPWLVAILYDERYKLSGAVLTLTAISQLPSIIGMTYDQAALSAGDSRGFAFFSAARAGVQSLFLVLGVMNFGLIGAIAALGLSYLTVYPILIRLSLRHHVWDPRHDLFFFSVSLALSAGILNLHWDIIKELALAAG